jgi:hypothetical protein
MKLVIGVISSRNLEYDSFKDIWIQNVIQYNRSNRNKIDVYFLYCHRLDKSYDILQIDKHIYDFFCNDDETFQNILKKTVVFFQYICQTEFDFLIRSNASTLFEFNKLFYWMHNKPNKLFFAGTYNIYRRNDNILLLSGTNLTFSKDTVCLIASNMNVNMYNEEIDDVAISLFMSKYDVIRDNIKRLDFTDTIIYNRCKKYDPDIFCFRFKSSNRQEDISIMYNVLNILYIPNYSLISFIKKTKKKVIEQLL